ncbi:MAG TPA: hypothetical protein VJL80_09190 [Aeromicrobium sp.]|jgi:hypothetical protein|nr:hypothetical protein [Aeromicrobium sp.]HKY58199.1 hypothetical protein [Aeromicrobium sp.]
MSPSRTASPQPRRLTELEQDALNKVRRRVGAVVFGVVTFHAVIALIGLSRHYDNIGRHGDATGLLIMSGLVSVFQYVGVRLILGRSLVSPWLLLGALPTTLGFVLR